MSQRKHDTLRTSFTFRVPHCLRSFAPLVRIPSWLQKHCHEQRMCPALPQYDPHNCTGFSILLPSRLQFLLFFFSRRLFICICTSISPLLPLSLSTLYAFILAIKAPAHSATYSIVPYRPSGLAAPRSAAYPITLLNSPHHHSFFPRLSHDTLPDRRPQWTITVGSTSHAHFV